MSIEIDVLNGDASWPVVEPLMQAVWPRDVVEKLSWGHVKWAHADLRVLIDAPEESAKAGLACHVGIYFRTVTWNGRKLDIGGIGGVSTREDCRGHGYATLALNAAVQTMRDHEAIRFAMLFCEPHNEAFYQARGWHRFEGEVYAEQPEGRVRFDAMAPFVFDFTRKPRDGVIDLCGLPW
ncbi:GNAT family N-acetyltransferase [Bradyrhizobium sp. KBS0727]|jgi:aminoglycoside 2'-N-acetyltransferase I|uniref:GNAT family N-acetyltransferase n=1 Tax=unclassified Bradyrhizobium TaxID=2631580 RepID=UPI00110EAF67|nr:MULTISPECIES: GNAT family N-acetyltransferase [unclassified Bradyrhizobium]QDW36520.1 GNAT family N-acetyltransferase [Bradyrhizobium sp. KBS0725]QDW43120.1 GNAT family N-acetyltransferase [Bradyrhizobium sp. KBS0727]